MSTETEAHSPIGASTMKRWKNCPGSVRLSKGLTQPPSKYAEEGTRAHALAADILLGHTVPNDVDHGMMEAVLIYVRFVEELKKKIGPKVQVWIEKRLHLSALNKDAFGTGDAVLYDPDRKWLYVIDYKHGAGVAVEIEEAGEKNDQLLYYAAGSLLELKLPCAGGEIIVVQPRCPHEDGPVRRAEFTGLEILDFCAEIEKFSTRTEDPNAPIVPGDWCRWCPAAAVCPALENKALSLAKAQFSEIENFDGAKLSETLQALDAVEAFAASVRKFAYQQLQQGKEVPGWKLVAKRPVRRWRDPASVAGELSKRLKLPGSMFFEEPALKSPPQVEKLVTKGGKKLLEDLVSSESSGLTLAHESDKRPAVHCDLLGEFEVIGETHE